MSAWRSLVPSCGMAIAFAVAASSAAAQSIDAAGVASEWLGPRPSAAAVTPPLGPFWQGSGAMAIEQQYATRVVRSWWPASIADARADAMLDGFASYLAAHAVEREFDRRYLRIAHSVETRPYLGDHIVWSFPTLRLSRSAAIGGDRYAPVFTALERSIGLPALQGAMFEVAHLPEDQLKADVIIKTMSNAAGQDLSWLIDAADTDVSYALTGLTATSVTAVRKGVGIFPGRNWPRTGEFESGDAVTIKVTFADSNSTVVSWDGRDQSRTFNFQGPSPVVAAHLDPDRIVTLDRNRLDNSIVRPSPTNVPVRKWTARWMVWLQHTMLSYGFLA